MRTKELKLGPRPRKSDWPPFLHTELTKGEVGIDYIKRLTDRSNFISIGMCKYTSCIEHAIKVTSLAHLELLNFHFDICQSCAAVRDKLLAGYVRGRKVLIDNENEFHETFEAFESGKWVQKEKKINRFLERLRQQREQENFLNNEMLLNQRRQLAATKAAAVASAATAAAVLQASKEVDKRRERDYNNAYSRWIMDGRRGPMPLRPK